MKILTAGLLTFGMIVGRATASADAPKPAVPPKAVKVTAADAAGPAFSSAAAVKSNDPGDGPVTDVVLLKSKDGRFESGLYQAGASDQAISAYPDDEFMYVLDGSIKLTASDGSVLEAKAGESLSIPKGWKGRWTTTGYKKYYVTYVRK
jgi:uncharacterized cupin superfamily protein